MGVDGQVEKKNVTPQSRSFVSFDELRTSAGWGNAVEKSASPRGNLGVTPWKTRRAPIEFWRRPRWTFAPV